MKIRLGLTVFAVVLTAFTMLYSTYSAASESVRCELVFSADSVAAPSVDIPSVLLQKGSLNLTKAEMEEVTRLEMNFVIGLRTTRPLHAIMNESLREPAKGLFLAYVFEGLSEQSKQAFSKATGYRFHNGRWEKISDKIEKLAKAESVALRADIDLQTAHLKADFVNALGLKAENTFNAQDYFTLQVFHPQVIQHYLRQQIAILGDRFGMSVDSILFDAHSRLELERLLKTNSAQHYFAIQARWMIDFNKPGIVYAYNPATPLSYWVVLLNGLQHKTYTAEDIVASASHFEEQALEVFIAFADKQKRIKARIEEQELLKLIAEEQLQATKAAALKNPGTIALPQADSVNRLQSLVTSHEKKLAEVSTESTASQSHGAAKIEKMNFILKGEHRFSSRHHRQASFEIELADSKEFFAVFRPGSTGSEILTKYPEEVVARLTRVVGSYFGNGQDLLPRDGHSSNLHHGIFSVYVSSYRILVTAKKISEENGMIKAKLLILAAYSKYQSSAPGRSQEHHYELANARLKAWELKLKKSHDSP